MTLDTTCEDFVCDVTLDSSSNSLEDMLPQICSTPTKVAASASMQDGKALARLVTVALLICTCGYINS